MQWYTEDVSAHSTRRNVNLDLLACLNVETCRQSTDTYFLLPVKALYLAADHT